MPLQLSRTQVVAYRMVAQGLGRLETDPVSLGVLDLGVQDVRGSAALAIAARLAEPPAPPLIADPLAIAWSFRGAPHVHRLADLPGLAIALWPRSEADAMARLTAERKALRAAGIAGIEAFTAAAGAMREVVQSPTPKGQVSAGVTERLPAAYSYPCRSCAATHVYGGLFQLVGLLSGTQLVPDSSPLSLTPLPNRPPVPVQSAGTTEVVGSYLRLQGPATLGDAAGYLGTSQAALRPVWPSDLAEVSVDGQRRWMPEDLLDELTNAPLAPEVRLLPPLDPYLQARDRELIAPDPAHRKALWRILANPGVVLVRGDVAGTWRAKAVGRKRLEITVQPLGKLIRQVRAVIDDEAARMARARGLPDSSVTYG